MDPTTFVGSSPTECVLKRCLLSGVICVCVFVEKLLGHFDRDSFCLVFKALLSTDLCDLGLCVDRGTVFVSLYFV